MAADTTVTIENTGESFACAAGTAILDAGLAAGLHMPHSCRGGACGTCKAKILAGEVDHGWVMSFVITDEEKADGYCLTCQSKPLSAQLRLRMVEPMSAKRSGEDVIVPLDVSGEVLAAHDATPSVRRLVVALPADARFRFRAGMNMELSAPGLGQPRPYSMAHAPGPGGTAPDGQLAFYVARHPAGRCSAWIHGLAAGESIALRGPYGDFHLPETARGSPVLALAGGTGLSPILSVVAQALDDGRTAPVDVLFSVRDRREAFALDALARLARRHENFRYRVTLTRDDDAPEGWLRGRVPTVLAREAADLSSRFVLVAGAPGFVADCTAAAVSAGARPDSIVVDSFVPRAAALAG